MPHPIVMMILIIAAAVVMSWLIPSGQFDRAPNGHVLRRQPTSEIPKQLLAAGAVLAAPQHPCGGVPRRDIELIATSIPAGHDPGRRADLHDHVPGRHVRRLRASGALDAGMVRLVAATGGNVYLLAPVLMIALSAGSTFLGLISEYLVLIPMMLVLAEKLRLGPLFAVALVAIPAKIGYLASVTNPLPLVIAQPIVGVPVFSGAGFRLVLWVVFLGLGIVYLLLQCAAQRLCSADGSACVRTALRSPRRDPARHRPRHHGHRLRRGQPALGQSAACRVLHRVGGADRGARRHERRTRRRILRRRHERHDARGAAGRTGRRGRGGAARCAGAGHDHQRPVVARARPGAGDGRPGAGRHRDRSRRADPLDQRQGRDLDADPVADRAAYRRERPDHGAGLSDRQRADQHGDADVRHAAGVSEHWARARTGRGSASSCRYGSDCSCCR